MKKNNYSKSFQLLRYKNSRRITIISIVIAVAIFLLSACTQLVLLNVSNINNNLMGNNGLMLIQMFGQSKKDQSCIIDIAPAQNIEHIVFATESFPLIIALLDEEENFVDDSLIVHRVEAEHSEYFGIEEMEEGVIYSPSNGTQNVSQYEMQEPYNQCKVELRNYDGVAPSVLRGEDFASIETYDRLKEISPEEEVYFSTPEYLIGVDSTENVYSVVRELHNMFPDYELQMYYQAEGLQKLVSNSKSVVYMEIAFLFVLMVTTTFIIQTLLSSMIHSLTKEMMIMHINGVSRRKISQSFFTFLCRSIKPYFIVSLIFSLLVFLWMAFIKFRDDVGWVQLSITLTVLFLVISCCTLWLKRSIYKKICHNTSNDNISRMLRN